MIHGKKKSILIGRRLNINLRKKDTLFKEKFPFSNGFNSDVCFTVVAADGFTYERQAILSWFEHSNRSPMTNQELENLELKPNYAIKSILQLLQDNNSSQSKSNSKDGNHTNAK